LALLQKAAYDPEKMPPKLADFLPSSEGWIWKNLSMIKEGN
jgi:hypothetical protein